MPYHTVIARYINFRQLWIEWKNLRSGIFRSQDLWDPAAAHGAWALWPDRTNLCFASHEIWGWDIRFELLNLNLRCWKQMSISDCREYCTSILENGGSSSKSHCSSMITARVMQANLWDLRFDIFRFLGHVRAHWHLKRVVVVCCFICTCICTCPCPNMQDWALQPHSMP